MPATIMYRLYLYIYSMYYDFDDGLSQTLWYLYTQHMVISLVFLKLYQYSQYIAMTTMTFPQTLPVHPAITFTLIMVFPNLCPQIFV